jgi:hypothetical protein
MALRCSAGISAPTSYLFAAAPLTFCCAALFFFSSYFSFILASISATSLLSRSEVFSFFNF